MTPENGKEPVLGAGKRGAKKKKEDGRRKRDQFMAAPIRQSPPLNAPWICNAEREVSCGGSRGEKQILRKPKITQESRRTSSFTID